MTIYHKGIGKKWRLTPLQDDAKCTACHEQFKEESKMLAHTHHAADSAGSNKAARIAMIAMTTNNSMRVNQVRMGGFSLSQERRSAA